MHIFEEEVKEQVDPTLYEERIGFLELTLDVDAVRRVMRGMRGDEAAGDGR
jgi:betaine reductase